MIVDFIALEAKYTQAGLLFPKAVLRVVTYILTYESFEKLHINV